VSVFKLNKDLNIYTSNEYDELISELSSYKKLNEVSSLERYEFPFYLRVENKDLKTNDVLNYVNSFDETNIQISINVEPYEIKSERLKIFLSNRYKKINGFSLIFESNDIQNLDFRSLLLGDGMVARLHVSVDDINKLKEEMLPINEIKKILTDRESIVAKYIGKDIASCGPNSTFYFSTLEFKCYIYVLYGVIVKSESREYLCEFVRNLGMSDFGIKNVEDAKNFIIKLDEIIKFIKSSIEFSEANKILSWVDDDVSKSCYYSDNHDKIRDMIKDLDAIIDRNDGSKLEREPLVDFIDTVFN